MNEVSCGAPAGGFVGRPRDLREHWLRHGGTPSILAGLVKSDLRRRFAEGGRPAVAEYLGALPELGDDAERMLSLIYEEFCLREEVGEAPNPDSFCDRYAPWRDSLASQLNYHRMLSQAAGGLAAGPPRFPEPGEHFLRFRLRSLLGQGGAAKVFLADDEDLGGRLSALKVSPDRGEEPSIMGRLQHAHIMPVHSVVRDPESGLRGLCMPYRPGPPLDAVLSQMGIVPVARRSARTLLDSVMAQGHAAKLDGPGWSGFPRSGSYADACAWLAMILAEALAHAHGREILHRDVKPANILISVEDGPQLLDFNLAHDPHAPDRAESALRGGTLPYMAPEQLEAFRDPDRWDRVGPTADLYALGLVLREMLTGRRPETPPADMPLARAINDLMALRIDGWPSVRLANPKVPHALDAIIRRCFAFDPADRYSTATALADDLRAYLRRDPLPLAENPSHRERVANRLKRNRLVLAGLALALAVAGGASALREGPPNPNDVLEQAAFFIERSRVGSSTLEQREESRRDAERLIHRTLELDPENHGAFHGLALLARDRGDMTTYRELIDRSIQAYESKSLNRGGKGPVTGAARDASYRAYMVNLHKIKLLRHLRPFERALLKDHAEGKGTSSETRGLAADLRSVMPDLEIALRYREACSAHKRVEIEVVAATAYSLLAWVEADTRKRAEYRDRGKALVDHVLSETRNVDESDDRFRLRVKAQGIKSAMQFL